jgi:hypothetical protein
VSGGVGGGAGEGFLAGANGGSCTDANNNAYIGASAGYLPANSLAAANGADSVGGASPRGGKGATGTYVTTHCGGVPYGKGGDAIFLSPGQAGNPGTIVLKW